MKADIKETIRKLFGQIKNTKVLLIIFIIGVALVMLPTGNSGNKEKSEVNTSDYSTYKKELEEDLKRIVAKIKDAGSVDVMITLEDDGDTQFATDENVSFSENGEEKTTSRESVHVFSEKKSDGDSPLIEKKTYPKISGVLICADGAKNPQVKSNIISAVEALLGVKSHRVAVMERK